MISLSWLIDLLPSSDQSAATSDERFISSQFSVFLVLFDFLGTTGGAAHCFGNELVACCEDKCNVQSYAYLMSINGPLIRKCRMCIVTAVQMEVDAEGR